MPLQGIIHRDYARRRSWDSDQSFVLRVVELGQLLGIWQVLSPDTFFLEEPEG